MATNFIDGATPQRPRGRRSALVVVGMQNDFVDEMGKRVVPDALSIVTLANTLREQLYWDAVVVTQVAHPADHVSFLATALKRGEDATKEQEYSISDGSTYKLQSAHVVDETDGYKIHESFQRKVTDYVQKVGTDQQRPCYSGFRDLQSEVKGTANTGLAAHLRSKNVTDVYVIGLGLEEMVARTADDAVSLGFNAHVVVDGCLGWSKEAGEAQTNALERAGVTIQHSSVLLEHNGNRRMAASEYIEFNKIHIVFQKLTAALVYHKPENPKEFMIQELEKLQQQKISDLTGLSLMTDEDLSTMFGMLDPIGKGQLTGKQVGQGLKGLGLSAPEPIDSSEKFDETKFKQVVLSSS